MIVQKIGMPIRRIRFLPDGARLILGLPDPAPSSHRATQSFVIRPVVGGSRVVIARPRHNGSLTAFFDESASFGFVPGGPGLLASGDAIHPFRLDDGRQHDWRVAIPAREFVIDPTGTRLVAVHRGEDDRTATVTAWALTPDGPRRLWQDRAPDRSWRIAGFVAEGDRFVRFEEGLVRVLDFQDRTPVAAFPTPLAHCGSASVSPDGRWVGLLEWSGLHVVDLTGSTPGGVIHASWELAKIREFVFHPDGRRVALLELDTQLVHWFELEGLVPLPTHDWGVGVLDAIAFSPDGMLGAVGGRRGRLVIWDAA